MQSLACIVLNTVSATGGLDMENLNLAPVVCITAAQVQDHTDLDQQVNAACSTQAATADWGAFHIGL